MEYNYKIDSVKFYCAVAVVLIHLTVFIFVSGSANIKNFYIYRYYFDIAVPFFFAASGYFIAIKNDIFYIQKHIRKLLTQYFAFSIFYLLIKCILIFMDRIYLNKPFLENIALLIQNITIENILNGTFGSFHLWFFPSLIMGSVLLLLSLKLKLNPSHMLLISFLLYAADIIDLLNIDKINYNNGTTQAFLCLSIGYYLAKISVNIHNSLLLFIISMITYSFGTIYFNNSIYRIVLILATFFLLFYCKNSHSRKNITTKLGKHSLDIYIMHVVIYELFYRILSYIGITNYNDSWWKIIIAAIICIILSIITFKPINYIIQQIISKISKMVMM